LTVRYFMLRGTRGKADQPGISDLRVVATLRSASRSLLNVSFPEILVRSFSGSPLECALTCWMYWLRQALRLPTSAVPKPRGYLLQNVHLHKKGRGWGPCTFAIFYRLPSDIMLRQATRLGR